MRNFLALKLVNVAGELTEEETEFMVSQNAIPSRPNISASWSNPGSNRTTWQTGK
jgi:hypothetical protein